MAGNKTDGKMLVIKKLAVFRQLILCILMAGNQTAGNILATRRLVKFR